MIVFPGELQNCIIMGKNELVKECAMKQKKKENGMQQYVLHLLKYSKKTTFLKEKKSLGPQNMQKLQVTLLIRE